MKVTPSRLHGCKSFTFLKWQSRDAVARDQQTINDKLPGQANRPAFCLRKEHRLFSSRYIQNACNVGLGFEVASIRWIDVVISMPTCTLARVGRQRVKVGKDAARCKGNRIFT